MLDSTLQKYQGQEFISRRGHGRIVFRDENSFQELASVQEAQELTRQVGGRGVVEFTEEMVVLQGRRARPVEVYFVVSNGELSYVGLRPQKATPGDEDKVKTGRGWVKATVLLGIMVVVGVLLWESKPGLRDVLLSKSERPDRYSENVSDSLWQQLSSADRDSVLVWLRAASEVSGRSLVSIERRLIYYRKVLKVHRSHRAALEGLKGVVGLMESVATRYLRYNQLDSLAGLISLGERYGVGDSGLWSRYRKRLEIRRLYIAGKRKLQNGEVSGAELSYRRGESIGLRDDSLRYLGKMIGRYYLREGQRYIEAGELQAAEQSLWRAREYLGEAEGIALAQSALRRARAAERARELALQREREAQQRQGVEQIFAQLGIEWVWVEGGSFEMGCTSEQSNCDSDEKPVHTVTVDGFYMSKYEVTVGQFDQFVKDTGYKTDAEKKGYSLIWDGSWVKKSGVNWRYNVQGNIRPASEYNHPVIHVSWNDAVAFCKWLSQKTGTTIRLPTEAEWEYAARGGRKSRGYKYAGTSNFDKLREYANYADVNTNFDWSDKNHNDGYQYTAPVGSFKPNELGLYDMSGNVWEWCLDWYDSDYYSGSPRNNPRGPSGGINRVVRGGSWYSDARYVRVADRGSSRPSSSYYILGFRLLRTR